MRFVVYTDTSKYLHANVFKKSKVASDFIAGGFAGFCSTMANNPVDVIKTRMQGVDAHKYNGFMDCGKQIMVQSGPLGFYAGVGPRLARVVLDAALTFSIFGTLKKAMMARLQE